jgi:hypothetical protein
MLPGGSALGGGGLGLGGGLSGAMLPGLARFGAGLGTGVLSGLSGLSGGAPVMGGGGLYGGGGAPAPSGGMGMGMGAAPSAYPGGSTLLMPGGTPETAQPATPGTYPGGSQMLYPGGTPATSVPVGGQPAAPSLGQAGATTFPTASGGDSGTARRGASQMDAMRSAMMQWLAAHAGIGEDAVQATVRALQQAAAQRAALFAGQ